MYLCTMTKWKVFVKWEGTTQRETITGVLYVADGYYKITDDYDKRWYFPMGRTVIEEV